MSKRRFTYKEFTLALGILVAVIIIVTLWLKPFSLEAGEVTQEPIRRLILPISKTLVERAWVVTQSLLQ